MTGDSRKINHALLADGDAHARRAFPALNTVCLLKGSDTVHSAVFRSGMTMDTPRQVHSITKSVIATLIGIAIKQGKINNVDQTLESLLKPGTISSSAGSEVGKMTLHQLLSMTSGMTWRNATHGIEPLSIRMLKHRNWAEFLLDLPIQKSAIGQFQYNSGGSHLLSIILTHATGLRADDFAQANLFDAMGIVNIEWQRDPQDYCNGGFGLQLSAADLRKLGRLYLRGGCWQQRQLVPKSWIKRCTTAHSPGYGYQWWLRESGGTIHHGRRLLAAIDNRLATGAYASPGYSGYGCNALTPQGHSKSVLLCNWKTGLDTRFDRAAQSCDCDGGFGR